MKYQILIGFIFIGLLSFAGAKKGFTEIKILPEENHNAYPGASFKIEVEAKNKKGKVKETANLFKNNLSWNSLEVTVDGGTFDKGVVTIDKDFYLKKLKRLSLVVADKNNPDVKDSYSFELNIKVAQIVDYSGEDGKDGDKGDSGKSSKTGTAETGRNGENGENGSNGKNLDVFITSDSISGERVLKIYIKEKTGMEESAFIISTNGGSLLIDVSGGKGGEGGRGGQGGLGNDGAKGGDGGSGGIGGSGGFGGVVNVTYDSTAIAYMQLISININAGEGGKGGRAGKRGRGDSNGSTGNSGPDGSNGYPGSEYRVLSPEKLVLKF